MWRDVTKPPYNGNIQMAVNAARQYGDTVYVPAGTYRITEAIRLPNCVSLIGDGYCSLIQLNNNRADNIIVADGYPAASTVWAAGTFRGETRQLRIAHLRLRGNGTATGSWQHIWGGNGIMLLAATDCLIEDCWIDNCYRVGILMSTGMGIDNTRKIGSMRNTIRNCRIFNCGGNGIDLSGSVRNEGRGSDFALIEGCHLEGNGIHAIHIVNSRFVRVVNNTAVSNKEDGIRVDQSTHVLVMGNAVVDGIVDSNGIKFSHCLHCSAIGNACHHNNQPNLELLNSQWCTLAYNVATASDAWGIISRTTVPYSQVIYADILPPYQDANNRQYPIQNWVNTGHIIEGNTAVGNKTGGIALSGTDNSVVAGNIAALNNQGKNNWGVAGIAVGYADYSNVPEANRKRSLENVVADNRCYDDQGDQTQKFGLRFDTGPNFVVGNNTVRNKTAGTVDNSGNNNIGGDLNNRT